ncbi:MAG: hypothetical protein IID41_03015 [Planctomycetes bacterium]|nr:hypothetical protein [Planctomycetota bacterium]
MDTVGSEWLNNDTIRHQQPDSSPPELHVAAAASLDAPHGVVRHTERLDGGALLGQR